MTAAAGEQPPTDEDIIKQKEKIEQEIRESQALLSVVQPFPGSLIANFADHERKDDVTFQLEELTGLGFESWVQVRGDGNCFYRAFGYEIFYTASVESLTTLRQKVADAKDRMISVHNFPEFTTVDFWEEFDGSLDAVISSGSAPRSPERSTVIDPQWKDQDNSDYLVVFLRLLVSEYMRSNAEMFLGYLGAQTIDSFVGTEVEPMGVDADEYQVLSLSQGLGVPLAVGYLDGRNNLGDPSAISALREKKTPQEHRMFHRFGLGGSESNGDGGSGSSGSRSVEDYVFLLYRPGHYDVLRWGA
eukprot:Clim_evm16s232 gene=Clim_evmTU16s232